MTTAETVRPQGPSRPFPTRRSPVRHRAAGRAGSPARRTGALDPRNNSLNLIRLFLAFAVLVSHAFPISGAGSDPRWAGESIGGWAVIGFFAVSGYLITGARLRSDGARYLMHRVARIFPGYVVCLVVVAFLFAPIAYVMQHGTLGGFLTTPNTPLNYILDNALLQISDYGVAGTLADSPHPYAWNGSLWSLYYEFLCYIIVGVAVMIPVVRRRAWPILAMFAASVLIHAQMPLISSYIGRNGDVGMLMKLLPYFLGGAALFVLKEKFPLRWYAALPALAVALLTVLWQPTWGGQLCAPLFTYVIMWLAAALPSPAAIRTHDLSYGVYIYAFPVSQLLVLLGWHEHGLVLYVAAITVPTLALAALSWLFVERPARDAVMGKRRAEAKESVPAPLTAPAGVLPVPRVDARPV